MSANVSDIEAVQQDDQHSIWNGRLKTNAKEAKFFLEMVDALTVRFDGMPTEEIMQTFWGEPREVLEKSIKKANKREKKIDAKFATKDLKKPSTANILFQRDFKTKCDKNGIKFDLKTSAAAYKALTDKERAMYVAEAQRLKAEYTAEYDRRRAAAIQSGAFPADKPKKPMTAYFRYLQDVRAQLTAKYVDDENRKGVNGKIAKESAEMWKALSDKQKEKYETAYQKDKVSYDIIIAKWENTETNRRKRNDTNGGAAEPVAIELSGSKKTKAPAAATPIAAAEPTTTTHAASSNASAAASESEAEPDEPVVKPAKQVRAAKPVVPKLAESEQEDEQEVTTPAPKAVKAATKTPTKPKSK